MSAPPTVLVPVGPLGETTLARLRQTLAGLAEHRIEDGPDALKATLEGMLQVGSSPRLDVLLFVDSTAIQFMQPAVAQVSGVLADHFARVFPPNATPEQRVASLQIVLYTPALTPSPTTKGILGACRELLDWSSPHPTLSRLWFAAAQTSAGVLSEGDLVSQGVGFALATVGAGIRDTDAIARRFRHGVAPIGFLSVATLDLPLGHIERWARTRAGVMAMTKLVDRVKAGQGRTPGLEPSVVDEWTAPFDSGPAAEALKTAAWKLAGGQELPERVTLGALEGARAIRARYPGLYAEPDASGVASPQVRDALNDLDKAHAHAVADVHNALQAPFAGRFGDVRPLSELPAFEHTLEQLRRRLDVRERVARREKVEGPPLNELEAATEALPTPGLLRLVGLAASCAAGFLVLAVLAATLNRPPPKVTANMTTGVRVQGQTRDPVTASQVVPWVCAGLSGPAFGLMIMTVAGRRSRASLLEQLKARNEALAAARASGLASGPSALAAERLDHHRMRVRTEARRAVEVAAARVTVIRDALIGCRATLVQRLDGFGVPLGSQEDLTPLFEPETPLHAAMLGPGATRDWVHRSRRYADEDVLADRILDASMPSDGLTVDVPASDPDAVYALARMQTESLQHSSLFDDADAAAEVATRAAAFAQGVAGSLAPGCIPQRADGMRSPGVRPGETFVVGPSDGRAVLEDAVRHHGELYWTAISAPLLVFVRTWEGYTLDELERGVAE